MAMANVINSTSNEVMSMPALTVELIPDSEQGGYTAPISDIPAYGEGDTEDEAIADLKEALRGYIEAFGFEDALSRLSAPVTVRQLAQVTDFAENAR
jgi:predicted RNase H-like HicB family nuclease